MLKTKKIEKIQDLSIGDILIFSIDSFINADLTLFSNENLNILANKLDFGDKVIISGINYEDNLILIMFDDKSLLELNYSIFEKKVEDPLYLLYKIFIDYSKEKSKENFDGFINDLRNHGFEFRNINS